MTQRMIRGTLLAPQDRQHVLAAYVYRNTIENARQHPAAVKQAGGTLPPITDAQWLAITDFAVRLNGRLDCRARSCWTHDSEIPARKAMIESWAASRS